MPVHKVDFVYERIVTVYLEAENEQEIRDFLDDNDEWDPLTDGEELIEEDELFEEDVVIERVEAVAANYCIHEGEICEVEE